MPVRLPRSRRLRLAVGAAVVAVFWIVAEPLGKGPLLLPITRTHGIDAGDLPAIALLLYAAQNLIHLLSSFLSRRHVDRGP